METNAVLIVDDSDTFRSAVRKCLSSKFELVEEAASVQEFEALYQRRRYDLVILDMRLDDRGEGRQGIEFIRGRRQHPRRGRRRRPDISTQARVFAPIAGANG
jgi:CheY-like chemotaxis protein